MHTINLSQVLVDEESSPLAHHTGERFTLRRALIGALRDLSGRLEAAGDEIQLTEDDVALLKSASALFRPAVAEQLHAALNVET
jgi:hypothetical protein